jgi:hypothetical protein
MEEEASFDIPLMLAHLGIIGLHMTEIAEASAITLGLLIACMYMLESTFEVRKSLKTWRKNHAKQK